MPPYPRYPRGRLKEPFVSAVRAHITPRDTLALLAGFTQQTQLSYLLDKRHRWPLSPLTRQRLTRVAELIDYPPDHISREEEPVEGEPHWAASEYV